MDVTAVVGIVGGGLGVVASAIALAAAIGRPVRRLARQQDEFREDWYGQPARPGRPPQPGVMERLASIEGQLHPNGGGSLRDAVNRVEQRLEDHLRTHGQPPPG